MQIGPRIRIGGTLGKIGNTVKKGVQKVASNPWAQAGLGFLTGGATIPLLAGTLGGALKEHAGVGDVLRGAAQGGAAGYGGSRARGLLNSIRGAGAAVAPPAPSAATSAAAQAPPNPLTLRPIAPGAGAPASVLSSAAPTAAAPSAAGFSARSALSSAGRFIRDNPTAAAMGLNAASSALTSGSENRINDAQADLLEQRADETQYDFEQRKRREEALRGLWSPLGTAIGSGFNSVARNPYAAGA